MGDYFEMTITEAFEEAGIDATKDQINIVVSWVEDAHENYGMAHGYDVIPNYHDREMALLKEAHEIELKELHEQIDCYRRSVAIRRGVNIRDVYLDNDGHVMYG